MGAEMGGKKMETSGFPKEPEHRLFEGVSIQWGKGEWEFQHSTLGRVVKPTYSILNPAHWNEIVGLLNQGKTAAGMMMGNFGVFKKLDTPGSADALFDKVKQRPKDQNFVALVHPENLIDFIDTNRLKEPYKSQLLEVEGRARFYAGPQHVILPVRSQGINEALIRQTDQTIACFWVPGHYGFEGLVSEAKEKIKHGLLGGGSLNIHGKEPYYDKDSLRKAMAEQKEWLEEIDFLIFDDIAEAGDIGRSHTMVRYLEEKSEVVRVGSLSIDKIREKTGHNIQLNQEVKYASSKTNYSKEENKKVNEKVMEVLQRIQRFNSHLKDH
jgi:tRNA A37 threonylcarbamoyladenosine synthetase subunit TsaC/SUA5/YrdC